MKRKEEKMFNFIMVGLMLTVSVARSLRLSLQLT